MAKRLTDNNPLMQKFIQLQKFMSELDVEIEWDGYRMNFINTQTGESAIIREAESGEEVSTVPYMTECKLVKTD